MTVYDLWSISVHGRLEVGALRFDLLPAIDSVLQRRAAAHFSMGRSVAKRSRQNSTAPRPNSLPSKAALS